MAKQARLEPKKNNGPEAAPWYVEVPQSLSETGRRQRLFFPTRQKAQAECERLKARKHNFGVSLQRLSANQIVEAAQAFELLKDYPQLSLKEAVRAHLEVLAARAKHEDINRLVLLTGHDDPDTMWRHYHRGTKKADAEKFWAIQPPVAQSNIIAFRKAQTNAS
jgi:hypothetical protein